MIWAIRNNERVKALPKEQFIKQFKDG